MVAESIPLQHNMTDSVDETALSPTCSLCQLPSNRPIAATIDDAEYSFCCYGCRHIYELVAPDLAQGLTLPEAMGQAGLDLNAPCCRGVIHGDPTEEARNILSRLMLNAFLGMMVMVLSLSLYSDYFHEWGEAGQSARSILQLIIMVFATPAVLMLALPILEDAIFTFQLYRRLTTSALIAIGTLAAYGMSVYATFTGNGDTYFETAVMTLLLVTLGRWLDAQTMVEGNKAIDDLLARAPTEATLILDNGQEERISIEQVEVGNKLRVRPGENFAVDGRILHGTGSVNQASITGESQPVYKETDNRAYAGTLNIDGSFTVEVTQVGEDRVMGKLVRLLDEARLHRAPIERLADQVAGYFVPIVLALALSTFIYWSWQVGWEEGMLNGMAVLLIACPCALGVATPLTIWTALGRAAQKSILIRDSLTLEKLSQLQQIFFDKTGTLTTGLVTLAEIVVDEDTAVSPTQLLQLAASLEHHSEHPLGRSILAAAEERGIALLTADSFRAKPGLGIVGQVSDKEIFVGSWRLVAQETATLPPQLATDLARLEAQGLTVIHVGWNGRVQGLLALRETIRPEAEAALQNIQAKGINIAVLTGDSQAAGNALGERLQVPIQTELLPPDKVTYIAEAETSGVVAMIGDGLNDAPALARASVGIALGCGADVTRETADVSLLGTDLSQISWLLALAKRAYSTIRWNLAWAFIYNILGIALAMTGYLHPILAAVAMVLSSALVVGNSLRLRNVT